MQGDLANVGNKALLAAMSRILDLLPHTYPGNRAALLVDQSDFSQSSSCTHGYPKASGSRNLVLCNQFGSHNEKSWEGFDICTKKSLKLGNLKLT